LVGAYVTSNRNTVQLQNSQERQQAQRLVESQIELLRNNQGILTSGDCFNGTAETGVCNNFSATNSGATYTVKINGPVGLVNPTGVYTITATWSSLQGDHTDDSSLTMYYRLN